MNEVYFLIHKFANQHGISDIFIKNGALVKKIDIEEKCENGFNHYYINKTHRREFKIQPGETLEEAYFNSIDDSNPKPNSIEFINFQLAENRPGEYHPRIFRPILKNFLSTFDYSSDVKIERLVRRIENYQDYLPFNQEIMISSVNQLSIFTKRLTSIFQTIHPVKKNFNVYGHDIRNLLIIVCTEVEAQLRGIFLQNIKSDKTQRLNTTAYYQLCNPLRLKEYAITFIQYPWLKDFSPFKDWNFPNTTDSLDWYNRYNLVKHDRENNFSKARLVSVIEAISALAILVYAQYGNNRFVWKEQLGDFFYFSSTPKWSPLEYYIPPFDGEDWKVKRFSHN